MGFHVRVAQRESEVHVMRARMGEWEEREAFGE